MGLFSTTLSDSRQKTEGGAARGLADSVADGIRDAARAPRAAVSSRGRARRSLDDDGGFDPEFSQKQRARRRLIGAVALVIAVAVVLPWMFDTRPPPVADAVIVQVQDSLSGFDAGIPQAEPKEGRRMPPPAEASGLDQARVLPPYQDQEAARIPDLARSASNAIASAPPPVPDVKPRVGLAAQATASSAAQGAQFLLLIGAFASESRARNWLNKLSDDGIPGYIEHKNVPGKGELALLRAGPFNDRALALAAQKRAEQIGLTPRLVQQP